MYAPKSAEGYLYASGSWVIAYKDSTIDAGTKKSMTAVPPLPESRTREISVATSLASPGLFGTWPMIDYCRGYAYIIFVKNLLGEERADAHRQLKKLVDEQLQTVCR